MPYVLKKIEKQRKIQRREARFYRALSIMAIIIMLTAAYMTYGYQEREIIISPTIHEKKALSKSQHLEVTGDLSLIPSENELEKILNKQMPDTCTDCDDKPLNCLDEYTINQILMTGERGDSILAVEVLTGKASKKYTVMINLSRNNTIVKKGGDIEKKECIEKDKSIDSDKFYIEKSDDSTSSHITIQ